MKSNALIPIAIMLCSILVLYDNQNALAFSITGFNNGTADVRAMAIKDDDTNFAVADIGTDSVYVRNQNTHALVATVTGVIDAVLGFTVAPQVNRAYFIGGASGNTVYEIDLINGVLVRSATTGCSATTQGSYVDYTAGNLYCALTTEVINRFSLTSFATTLSYTTLNAGATPCDGIEALWYNSATDTMFAGCGTTANIVAVIDITASGTPDFSVAYEATVSAIAFNKDQNNIVGCSSGADVELFDYSPSTGFTFDSTIGLDNCGAGKYAFRMYYDTQSNRYFQISTSNNLIIFDGTTGTSLISSSVGVNDGQIQVISNTELWGNMDSAGAGNDYYVVDLTGIPLGASGTNPPGDGDTGGIDCLLPENAQVLICRVTQGECQGNVLICVGDTVLGNATEGTGLIGGVICAVGFIDCEANPDIKTNGIGYLLLAIALGIEIGILWVASRGDLRQVPTFIWFVATIAIIAALTLFNWIDATMLVLGVIVAVALAAAKARGFFGGDSF